MDQNQLDNLKTWFDDYVNGFYGSDEYINANIKLKEDHSRRTGGEMQYLIAELDLEPDKAIIAETIALLHDIGRFEQFTKYNTYNDHRSINHNLLALDVIEKENILEGISVQEQQLIKTAIKHHGDIEIPNSLDADQLLYAKLIRDADKLDIYFVVTSYYKEYAQDPENFKLEIEFPNEPWYSPEVIEDLLGQRRTDYTTLKTWNDAKLLQLGWVYDVNFPATLKRIKQRCFLEDILTFLPRTDDIQNVREKIFEYINQRIEQDR